MFRIPSRMLFFASFAVAMLAGIGIDVFAGHTERIRPGQALLPKLLAGLALITAGLMMAAFLRDASSELPTGPAETSLSAFMLSPKTWSLPGNWKTWAWLTAGLSLICGASLTRKKTDTSSLCCHRAGLAGNEPPRSPGAENRTVRFGAGWRIAFECAWHE